MTRSSPITPAEELAIAPEPALSPSSLLERAELNLFEWKIPQDQIQVTDHQGILFNLSTGHFHGSTRAFLNRIHMDDRDILARQLRQVSRGIEPQRITFRMRTTDGSLQLLTLSGQLIKSDQGLPLRMVGVLQRLSDRETSEDRLHRQQAALLQWAVAPEVTEGELSGALRLIMTGAADILDIEQVSLWFYEQQQQILHCRYRYRRSLDQHDSGMELPADQFPLYLHALEEQKVIAATDARSDPMTGELCNDYLVPAGITSKLDIGIVREGQMVGLIAFEHVELPRQWRVDERGFAISIADMITTILEMEVRREAESALTSQQQLLQDLVNNSASLVYMRDLEGNYLLTNRQYRQTQLDSSPKSDQAAPPDCATALSEQIGLNDRRVARSGQTLSFEEQIPQPDGLHTYLSVKFPVRDPRGNIYAVAGISTDITDRIHTEAALKESERRHRTLFESSLDAMLLIDSAQQVVDCNPAAQRLFNTAELVGHAINELFPQQHSNGMVISPALSHEDEQRSFERRCRRPDGCEFDAEVNLSSLKLSGHPHQLLCIRDISLRKQRDELVLRIARGLSVDTGENFFRSLLQQLSEVMAADYALVGQLNDTQDAISSLCNFAKGEEIEKFDYPLEQTPCQQVIAGETCVYSSRVQQIFPRDEFLKDRGIEAYAGAVLTVADRPVGVLVVLFCHPIETPELFQNLLQIFAVRAAGELQRQSNEAALVASEERYRAFIGNSSEGIWRTELTPPVDITLDIDTQVEQIISNSVIIEANQALARMHDTSLEQFYQATPKEFFGPGQQRDLIREWIRHDYRLNDQEFQLRNRQGEPVWLSSSYSGVIENDRLVRIWGTRRDITQTKEYLSAIEYQAEHDALTHLPNRFWLNDHLRRQIREKKYGRGLMALLLLDLDHFKEVNDSLGHHTGDQLLRLIGPRLSPMLEQHHAHLARLGGDEFAVVLDEVNAPETALAFAEAISQSLHQPFRLEGIQLEIHCSVGIALYPEHGEEPSALLRCADVAMYLAKKSSKAFALYSSHLDEHSPRRLALMSELGQAIRDDQLVLHYQPQLELASGKISGLEALVRWQHPSQGMIPPGHFIHLAEMGDLIRPLTLWVLDNALAQWQRWQQQGHELQVAVNLSTRNLMDDACPQQIKAVLDKYQAPPRCLELEITESALIADPQRALASLNEISDFGVELSIDDFGTGYSSLAYLKELPIDRLKIDMSFIRNMTEDRRDEMIVNSTIHLAHSLGLKVVAEGVENRQALEALREMGCDYIQGYYIGRPQAPELLKLS